MGAMRYLGVDPGGRRIGLALGDDATSVVVPLEVLVNNGLAAASRRVADRAREHDITIVVIGLPTSGDGTETPGCQRSHQFADAIKGHGLTAVLQPEHLTSVEARERARASGRPRQAPVDDLAAQIILEDYLASLRSGP